MATSVKHMGPASSTFPSTEMAGEMILRDNFESFPQTDASYIIPQVFPTDFPELADPNTGRIQRNRHRVFSQSDERKLRGIEINLCGKGELEYNVYSTFAQLIRKTQPDPILMFNTFTWDKFKSDAIKLQYKFNPLRKIKNRSEHDFVVLVKDLGAILIEVKRSSSASMLNSAQRQLDTMQEYVDTFFNAVTTSASRTLPIVKIIAVPMDAHQSFTTPSGYFHMYQDALESFDTTWTNMVVELRLRANSHPVSSLEFTKLANLMTGLYFMKSTYYDYQGASLSCRTKTSDNLLDTACLSSDALSRKIPEAEKGAPVSDVEYNPPGGLLRTSKELQLLYFTPEQKILFDTIPKCIIRAAAGCGKTILILFKILELIENGSYNKILLVAPPPHHLRVRNFLSSNNVTVHVSKAFPPVPNSSTVVVMEIDDFLKVPLKTLLEYDLSGYAMFMDDLHSFSPSTDDEVNYPQLSDFLVTRFQSSLHTWVCLDAAQQHTMGSFSWDIHPIRLLYTAAKKPIPSLHKHVYYLYKVLRNSRQITKHIIDYRDFISLPLNRMTSHNMKAEQGHNIHGADIMCERLINSDNNRENISESFFISRMTHHVTSLLSQSTSSDALKPTDVAVICYGFGVFGIPLLADLQRALLEQCNVDSSGIADQLNNKYNVVVVDTYKNVNSAEWTAVIYITSDGSSEIDYRVISRARSRLVLLLGGYFEGTSYIEDTTRWEEREGTFVQM